MADLAAFGRSVRCVQIQQLHVTLQFLGEIADSQTAEIGRVLDAVAAEYAPFAWQVKGTGVFPHRQRPGVVWAGVHPVAQFRQLSCDLQQQLQPLGFQPEQRPLTPHLTLARIRGRAPRNLDTWLDQTADTDLGAGTVSRIVLMQSVRDGSGHRHVERHCARLSRS